MVLGLSLPTPAVYILPAVLVGPALTQAGIVPIAAHPVHFCFIADLLLIGHWSEVTLSIITALIGAILLGVGLVGYLFRPVRIVRRILFVIAAIGLLTPVVNTGQYAVLTWASNSVDALLAAILFFSEWLKRSSRARAPTTVVADS